MSIEAMKRTFDFLHDLWGLKQTTRSERHRELMWELEQAIEQADKPVAWWNPNKDTVSTDPVNRNNSDCVPLYTTPPQREWVGLTDEDMYQLRREGHHYLSERDFRAIEAKLKEKNHG